MLYVELVDLERKEQIRTFHRDRRRCTFTEELNYHGFDLILRLDWGVLVDGEPMLDLDVVQKKTDGTRVRLKPKHIPVHHTSLSSLLSGSTEPRVYDLQYEGLRLRLVAKKTFAVSIEMSAYIANSISRRADEA